jgi:hypothetical protein
MDQARIFYPMCALAALTFTVLLLVPVVRVRALYRRRVTIDDFKLGESANVPADVSLPNRNYMNLLQLPVLFYAVCLALFVSRSVDDTALTLAWVYVGLRVIHSFIHVTYNDVVHRLVAFAGSNIVLLVAWIRFFASVGA